MIKKQIDETNLEDVSSKGTMKGSPSYQGDTFHRAVVVGFFVVHLDYVVVQTRFQSDAVFHSVENRQFQHELMVDMFDVTYSGSECRATMK